MIDETKLAAHVRELNRCNQRGGRMLSLVDLLDAGTVDLALGGYLAAIMRSGASHLVGANPGGAGKTTVMAALLNWLPNRTDIYPAANQSILEEAGRNPPADPSTYCYVAHEVGQGSWYAYIWGQAARIFFSLPKQGYIIATNLHADTLQQAQQQLLVDNGVTRADLDAVQLKVFLRVERGRGWQYRRSVSYVYESDGSGDRLVWSGDGPGAYQREDDSVLVTWEQERAYMELLEQMQRDNVCRIEDVRRLLLAQDW